MSVAMIPVIFQFRMNWLLVYSYWLLVARRQVSAQPPAKTTAGLIKKETNEHRITPRRETFNIELSNKNDYEKTNLQLQFLFPSRRFNLRDEII